jgi:hypothetical protein
MRMRDHVIQKKFFPRMDFIYRGINWMDTLLNKQIFKNSRMKILF